jgi:hypothetical protein
VLAAHLEGPTAVSLRRPIPLDEELDVRVEMDDPERVADGAERVAESTVARAFDAAGELVAEAVSAAPLAPWDAPPVSLKAAHRAKKLFAAPADGFFDECFVCGRSRADGFHLHPGPVEGTDFVASPWTAPSWAADASGAILPEFVWAALDCPGYFALHGTDLVTAFLARQQSEVHAPLRAGVEYAVVGWPLERAGRKGFAATAILDPDGAVLAQSEQLLIVPRDT